MHFSYENKFNILTFKLTIQNLKNAHMENKITKSNEWRNKIKVIHLFEENTTPELIITLCDTLIKQLETVQEKESTGNMLDDEKSIVDSELGELVGHFQFLRDLANGKIPETEWSNYDFDGEFEGWFNDYFEQLYDLGDKKVMNKKNVLEKFMWID